MSYQNDVNGQSPNGYQMDYNQNMTEQDLVNQSQTGYVQTQALPQIVQQQPPQFAHAVGMAPNGMTPAGMPPAGMPPAGMPLAGMAPAQPYGQAVPQGYQMAHQQAAPGQPMMAAAINVPQYPAMPPPGQALQMQPVKQAPAYPNMAQTLNRSVTAKAYNTKYKKDEQKAKTWRLIICVGLIMVIFSVLTMIIGVSGIILAVDIINQDEGNRSEIQAARIILEGLESWDEPLGTDITVVDKDTPCGSDAVNLFELEWLGSKSGCFSDGQAMDYGSYRNKRSRQNKSTSCGDPINEVEPVTQSTFSNKRICVTRKGDKMVDMAQSETSGCPSGTVACSTETENWYDRSCVTDVEKCPITAMEIVADTELSTLSADWGAVSFTDGMSIVYSKTSGTKGPITSTHVGMAPCIDSAQVKTTRADKLFYPLERGEVRPQCTIDLVDVPVEDPRFTQLSLYEVSQYSVQSESGVLAKLEGLKNFAEFVDIDAKKNFMLSFWARPAIAWTCSRSKQSEAIAVMKDIDLDDLEDGSTQLTTAMILASVYLGLIFISTIVIWCFVIKCRHSSKLKYFVVAQLVTELALSLTCMILAFAAARNYNKRSDNLKELDEAVQGCMDAYSDISDSIIEKQLEDPASDGGAASAVLAVFAVLVIIKLMVVGTIACCIKCKRVQA